MHIFCFRSQIHLEEQWSIIRKRSTADRCEIRIQAESWTYHSILW